jgi:hypothetical protein
MVPRREEMTEFPKIVETVKDLSKRITDFIMFPKASDKRVSVHVRALNRGERRISYEVILNNDLQVEGTIYDSPEYKECRCSFDNKNTIRCNKESRGVATKIFDDGKSIERDTGIWFDYCPVRKYSELGAQGFLRKKWEKEKKWAEQKQEMLVDKEKLEKVIERARETGSAISYEVNRIREIDQITITQDCFRYTVLIDTEERFCTCFQEGSAIFCPEKEQGFKTKVLDIKLGLREFDTFHPTCKIRKYAEEKIIPKIKEEQK